MKCFAVCIMYVERENTDWLSPSLVCSRDNHYYSILLNGRWTFTCKNVRNRHTKNKSHLFFIKYCKDNGISLSLFVFSVAIDTYVFVQGVKVYTHCSGVQVIVFIYKWWRFQFFIDLEDDDIGITITWINTVLYNNK